MTSMVAIIPIASMAAANTTLETAGFGPRNFSVPAYTGAAVTHGALHSWHIPAFEAAVQAIAGAVVEIGEGDPITRTQALIQAQGAKWGAQAPALPSSGTVTAGSLYRFEDLLWSVIQTFSRTTYSAHPSTYPALIRRIAEPGVICEWWQPLDQFDAPKLVNPFTGKPDQRTHAGKVWVVTQADGSGNNTWQPGVFGWAEVVNGEVQPEPVPETPTYPAFVQPTGAHDAYKIGDRVSFNGSNYESKINGNVWSPTAYPAGWQLIP